MERRQVLALLGAGVLGERLDAMQSAMQTLRNAPESYKLAFFTAEQERLIDRVSEMILPADDRSGGAHAARVSYYIDLIAANSSAEVQEKWKSSLAAFEQFVAARRGKAFLELRAADQSAVLDALAAGLRKPRNAAEEFFAAARRLTIAGYYTSKIGLMDELGYKGNKALSSYPGCQHRPGAHG